MKRLLILLVPAVLASCSDNDSTPAGEIVINGTLASPSMLDASPLINGTRIAVTAFTSLSSPTPQTLMDNVVVSKTENRWSYSPAAKWPGEAVDFYAYSPIGHVAPTITAKTQQAQLTSDGTEDFIFASLKGIKRTDGTANLNFRHALAKVNFAFSCGDATEPIYVNTVRLSGIASTGTFTWPKGPTGIGAPEFPGTWTLESEADGVYLINAPQTEPEQATPEGVVLNSTMVSYFIPQGLHGAKLEFEVQKGVGGPTTTLSVELTGSWEQAKAYLYKITVGRDKPEVSVTHY